jgi:hypothetical protein
LGNLRLWLKTVLRFLVGTYFVLTSLYCLLAFLPYTYFFLVKAPAYAWMPWFVRHQAPLYWMAAAAAIVGEWDVVAQWRTRKKDARFLTGYVLLVACGIYLSARPFLRTLEDNSAAYWWSLAALLPLIGIALWRRGKDAVQERESDERPFAYSSGLLVA